MRTINIGKITLEIFDAIDELPIKRFHKFNKYMLIDAGIGSDLNDINAHIAKVSRYMEIDKDKAKIELENLRQSLYLIAQERNVRHMSFAILIKSINGKEVFDISDENLERIMGRLGETPTNLLESLLASVKKKIEAELNLYFPGQFDTAATKEQYDQLRRKALLGLGQITRGEDNQKEIDKLDDEMLEQSKPQIFSGKASVEIEYQRRFEEMCIILKKELGQEIEGMSALQFYTAFNFMKKSNKTK